MSAPDGLSDLNDKFQNALAIDATPTPVQDDLLDQFVLTDCPNSQISSGRALFSSSSSASQSRQSGSSEFKTDPTSGTKFPSGKSNDHPDDDVDADSGGKKKNHGYKPRKQKEKKDCLPIFTGLGTDEYSRSEMGNSRKDDEFSSELWRLSLCRKFKLPALLAQLPKRYSE